MNNQQSFYLNVMKILKSYDPSFELKELDQLTQDQLTRYINNIKNKYTTFWKHTLINSSKLSFLSSFKSEFKLEEYLSSTKNPSHRRLLSKFRTSSHKLHIESGRYNKTPREQRLCEYCDTNEIEDEYHFTLSCKYYEQQRNDLTNTLQNDFNVPINFQTTDDLLNILSSNNPDLLNIFSKFLFVCFKKRNECLETRLHSK